MNQQDFFGASKPRDHTVVKSNVVVEYFAAWIQIMNLQYKEGVNPDFAYLDFFAGPGMIGTVESTPLRIIRSILNSGQDRIVKGIHTHFNDHNIESIEKLKNSMSKIDGIDKLGYKPELHSKDMSDVFPKVIELVRGMPTFVFMDPFGYKGLSQKVFKESTSGWGCDLLLFFNANRIVPATTNPKVTECMEELWGISEADRIREEVKLLLGNRKEFFIIDEFTKTMRKNVGPYIARFRMQSNGKIYYLMMISKHKLALEKIKPIMSKYASRVNYYRNIFEYQDGNQVSLIDDLEEYRSDKFIVDKVETNYRGKVVTTEGLTDQFIDTCAQKSEIFKALKLMESTGKATQVIEGGSRRKTHKTRFRIG